MCCRYWMESSPELRPFVEAANRSPLRAKMVARLARPLKTAGEIRPTDMVPAVAPGKNGAPAVFPMIWGFSNPRTGAPLVNCRVETAAEKPLWKEAWRTHRCVIPASWYYEWEHLPSPDGKPKTGQKYLIQPKGYSLAYLAGLYRIEESGDLKYPVFSVLTREPGENIRFIHDRMPLILPGEAVRSWLRPDANPEAVIKSALTDMVYDRA